ncbi:MAG: hypothetical protein V9G20_02890 [Candidatus Promineifilaceae bacterium]
MNDTIILPEAISAAAQGAIVVDRSNLGMLKFTGATRLDLIHRMSTQHVKDLISGQGAATVLTSDIARIIDRIILYAARDAVYCLTGENNNQAVARYLMRFVFFNDDFHIEDLTATTTIWGVYGAKAGEHLAAAGFPTAELPLHHWRELSLDGLTLYLHRTDPVAGDGYLIMGQKTDHATIGQKLVAAGCTLANEATFDYLRIATGQPRFGHELTQEYIPLEAGLWADVSFKKGCYIGQEIIARMESRGKLAKKIMRLRPAGPVVAGMELTTRDGAKAGQISSAAAGPDDIVALGYVRTTVLNEHLTLYAGNIPLTVLPEPTTP